MSTINFVTQLLGAAGQNLFSRFCANRKLTTPCLTMCSEVEGVKYAIMLDHNRVSALGRPRPLSSAWYF